MTPTNSSPQPDYQAERTLQLASLKYQAEQRQAQRSQPGQGTAGEGEGGIELDDDPVRWIEKNFFIPELMGPVRLEPYHAACLREALRRDPSGKLVYSLILWSDIKKSIKSTIAAAVGLWMAYQKPWRSIKVIANDLKQADSRVAFYMRRAIELNPAMRDTVRVKASGYLIELPNHSRIEAVPIDPTGEAGGNDDVVIYSELWGAASKAAQQMWTETTLSPTKFGESFRWVETYAGHIGHSPVLEQLYETGVQGGKRIDDAVGIPGLELFALEPARMLSLWNTVPRCPWQTPEYYAQEAAQLTPNEFLRVHRNQWVSRQDVFVAVEWWMACQVTAPLFALTSNDPVVIALDAGVSSDCFGMVAESRRGNKCQVRYARKWTPPTGGTIDFSGPEAELERLVKEYNVIEVAYDPYQLHDLATRLRKKLIVNFRPFPQDKDRLVADKQLQDMIRERRIEHNGEPDLTEHVKNADAKTEGDKLRIIKRSESGKIDLCVCLSMATGRLMKFNIA